MRNKASFSIFAVAVTLTLLCVSCTPEPIAALSADKTTIEEGETVQFTDLSSGEPTSWLWEFQGGTPSISQNQNPTVNYANEGTYTVSLEVKNRGGANLVTMNNYITVEKPTTDLTFINQTYTEISMQLNGISRTIPRGESVTYFDLEGISVNYTAETSATTAQGNPIGLSLYWDYDVVLEGGEQDYDLFIGPDFFFLYMINDGTHILGPLEVDHGDPEPSVANVSIPTDGIKYRIGYYRARADVQIRAYYEDDPESWTYWDANVHFFYPNEDNQSVELTNPFKKGTDPNRVLTPLDPAKVPLPASGQAPQKLNLEGASPSSAGQ